jgi:hypothetical protein
MDAIGRWLQLLRRESPLIFRMIIWITLASNSGISRTFPFWTDSGSIIDTTSTIYGTNTALAFGTWVPAMWSRATGFGKLNHLTEWDDNKLNSTVLFQMEQLSQGRKITPSGACWLPEFLTILSQTSILPICPGHTVVPMLYLTIAGLDSFRQYHLGWKLSNENFLSGNTMIDNLKLRASTGLTGSDLIIQNIANSPMVGATGYRFGNNNVSTIGFREGRLGSSPLSYEKSFKSNIGFDLGLFEMLDITMDAFYNRRSNILVETEGSISGVIGIPLPYNSSGIVDNRGFELGMNLYNNAGDFNYRIGGYVSYAKNKIIEMAEPYRPYDYMKRTGQSVGQAFGLESIGFFSDAADIANSPQQRLFSFVRPGDIKYKDQNGDGIIDEFDVIPIGYSTLRTPELYFSGIINLQYRNFGAEAFFQGISRDDCLS